MTMLDDDELYHFGVKGMKWGVRRAKRKVQKAQNRKQRDLDFTDRFGKVASGHAKKYRDTANKLKKSSDEDYSKMFDDPALLERQGGAHKSRLDEIKANSYYSSQYTNVAKQWAKAHDAIMNTPIDAYVKDIKTGKKIIVKMMA